MYKTAKESIRISKDKLKSTINRPALSSIAYTVSSLISRGAGFLFTPFFTRLYSPSEFGVFSMFQSYLSILFIFGSLEICSGVIIRLLISEGDSKDRLILCTTRIMLISSLITLAVFFILRGFLPEESFFGFGAALIISTLCRCIISAYISNAKFHYKIRSVIAVNFVESTLPPIITLMLYKALNIKGIGLISTRVLVYSAVLLLIAIPIYISIRSNAMRSASKSTDKSLTKKILKSALPMLPYYVSMIIISQGDKVLVGKLLGEGALGGYGIAYSLGSALTMLSGGILGVLMPWISRKLRDGNFKIAKQVSSKLYRMSALITLIILCISPELLSILAPKSYGNTLILVFPIALSAPTLLLQSLTVTANLRYGISLGVILSGVVPASVFLWAGFILIPTYGVIAAAVSLPLSYLISFMISSIILKIKSQNSLLYANDYLQTSLLLLVFSAVIYQINSYLSVRIALFFILSTLLLFALAKSRSLIKEPV